MKNLLVLFTLSFLLVCAGAQAQNRIYKTTDSHGNVVYTDRPPAGGAQPMDLPQLSIVSPRENQQAVKSLNARSQIGATTGQTNLPPMAQLRQTYSAAEIIKPAAGETLWGTGSSLQAVVDLKTPLLPGLMVQFIYDGRELPPRPSGSVTLDQVARGEHTIAAEIVDTSGQVVGRTQPVTFYMRQHSVNFNNSGNNPANNNPGN